MLFQLLSARRATHTLDMLLHYLVKCKMQKKICKKVLQNFDKNFQFLTNFQNISLL